IAFAMAMKPWPELVGTRARRRRYLDPTRVIENANTSHRLPTTADCGNVCAGLGRFDEALIRARRRGAALALILRAGFRAAVWVFGRAGQPEKAELTDLHARPQRDRQVGDVGKLEGDVPAEARVDETRRRVRQQAEAAEQRLAFQTPGEVDGQRA